MAITCTPADNIAILQCSQCWTPKQKLMVLAAALCAINNGATGDCDAETMLADAACYTCASDTQLLQAVLGILYQYAIDVIGITQEDIDAWIASSRACFECVTDKQIKAMIVQQLCTFYNNAAR